MSISRRLALTLGGVVAVLVICLGVLNLWLAGSNLRGAVDALLVEQADSVEQISAQRRGRAAEFDELDGRPLDDALLGRDARFEERGFRLQFIAADGSVTGDSGLPIDSQLVDDVRESDTDALRTVEIDGRKFRVITRSTGEEVIQIATDITSVEDGLSGLRKGAMVLGLVGIGVAALLGWVVARRFTKPIKDVTAAAAQLAGERGLPLPIETDRTDEIGDLAASFNGLLSALEVSREQQLRLVSDAGHELGTPLTSLRLKMEFLQSQPDLPAEKQRAIVDGAAVELEALGALASELVDLASNGADDEVPQLVNLGETVEEAARRARLTTQRVITTSTDGVVVTARPAMVRRALSNLIGNAHNYSPPDEPIEIHEHGGGIEVRDHGPGIDPEERPYAFDRFFRARDTQHLPGSGIGLAIVKQTADLHRGRVWIDDAPGGGAVVGFSVATDEAPTGT